MSEGVVEANIAKEMEAEFKLLLQERFDESKEVEKAFITPFLGQEWKSFKATAQDLLPRRNRCFSRKIAICS